METLENKENEKKAQARITTKSSILLPILFGLTLAFFLCSIFKENFKEGLSPFVIWAYFIVVLVYIGISVFDLYQQKTTRKKKIFILLFSILTCIVDILFILYIR